MATIPSDLLMPMPAFAELYRERCDEGWRRIATSKLAFVGLARNCGQHLADNLKRLAPLQERCREWCLHIESNDCDDDTLGVLASYASTHRQATYHYSVLGRGHHPGEFAGRRTIALAEYRDACQRWVRACASNSDYVVAIDWDAWGGWMDDGLANGIGWLVELQGAFAMASVSLAQSLTAIVRGSDLQVTPSWMHYDAWALRLNSAWDDYGHGQGGWKHQWLPPIGSPPVPVVSAFGGLAIYRTADYLAGTYDGADCEHVPFHVSIAKATGRRMYLCPAMRTVMHWMEPPDAADGLDGLPAAAGDAA